MSLLETSLFILSQNLLHAYWICCRFQIATSMQLAWNSSDCFESFSPLNNGINGRSIQTLLRE